MRNTLSFALVGGLLLLASALSGETWAKCTFARLFNSANPTGYSYVYTPGLVPGPESTTVSEKMQGAFWMLGHGVPGPVPNQGVDNGRFEAIVVTAPGLFYYGWVRGYPNYGAYIQGPSWASSPDIDPCPDIVVGQRCMAILLTDEVDGNGYFAFLTDEADGSHNYDFVQPANAPIDLIEIPKPAILGTAYHVDGADFGLVIGGPDRADLEGGLYLDPVCLGLGDVVGYKIYSQPLASGSEPPVSRDRTFWTDETPPPGVLDLGSTFTVPFDCSGDAPDSFDVYLALGLVFESRFELQVSRNSTRVACGPTIAESDDLDLKPRRMPRRKTKR
jgi:hypothetical protein